MERLEPTWRTVLPEVLAAASGHDGPILDLRSPANQAIGMPVGLGDRTVTLTAADWRVGLVTRTAACRRETRVEAPGAAVAQQARDRHVPRRYVLGQGDLR
jgi:hypothetical protein